MDPSARQGLMWHTVLLSKATRHALDYLSHESWLHRSNWYLAGGTALAIQAGHRSSVDLDFFTPKNAFPAGKLIQRFPKSAWQTDILREGTLYGRLLNAKVSFIAYPFFIPALPFRYYGTIPVLTPRDIAVMKIVAISQRGRKRDFIDLFWYCTHAESLEVILQRLPDQYPTVTHNYFHIYKSLTYFDDAEKDPMPKIFFKASWNGIKKFFRSEVPKATRKILKLR